MASIEPFEFFDPASGRTIRIQPIFTNPDCDPVVVSVSDVIACVDDSEKWFVVKLDTGELTIARVDVRSKVWTRVAESQWPSIALNGGLPEKMQTVKCLVCGSLVDAMFPCSKDVDELLVDCPKCGFRIDVEQAMHADDGSDDDMLG